MFKRDIDDVLCFMTEVASGSGRGGNGYGYRKMKRRRLVNGFEMEGKRVAPVEFVFIGGWAFLFAFLCSPTSQSMILPGVLLYVTRDVEDDEWRALSILNLRKRVRKMHTDIRTNTACARTCWMFIEDIEEDLERSKESESKPLSDNQPINPSTPKRAAKIKNQMKDEGEANSHPKPSQTQARPSINSIATSSTVVGTPRTQRIAITQTPKRIQSQKQLPTPTSSLKRNRSARDVEDRDGGGDDVDSDVDSFMESAGNGDRGRGGGYVDMVNVGNGDGGKGDQDDDPPVYYDPNRPVNAREAKRSRDRIINRGWRK